MRAQGGSPNVSTAPAPTTALWRKCGHPRTPENTTGVSARLPGGRCRECYCENQRRYEASEKGRATQQLYNDSFKCLMRSLNYAMGSKLRALDELGVHSVLHDVDLRELGAMDPQEFLAKHSGLQQALRALMDPHELVAAAVRNALQRT